MDGQRRKCSDSRAVRGPATVEGTHDKVEGDVGGGLGDGGQQHQAGIALLAARKGPHLPQQRLHRGALREIAPAKLGVAAHQRLRAVPLRDVGRDAYQNAPLVKVCNVRLDRQLTHVTLLGHQELEDLLATLHKKGSKTEERRGSMTNR